MTSTNYQTAKCTPSKSLATVVGVAAPPDILLRHLHKNQLQRQHVYVNKDVNVDFNVHREGQSHDVPRSEHVHVDIHFQVHC